MVSIPARYKAIWGTGQSSTRCATPSCHRHALRACFGTKTADKPDATLRPQKPPLKTPGGGAARLAGLALILPQELRQLRHVGRDPPGLHSFTALALCRGI